MWVLNTWWSLFAYSLLAFSLQRAISHMVAKKKLIWYSQTQKFQSIFLVTESESEGCPVVSDSWRLHRLCSPWNCPGQNTGVGSFSLLQGIFPTQGLNPGFPHCRQILYQLSYQGSLVTKAPIWLKLFLESVTKPYHIQTLYSSHKTDYSAKVKWRNGILKIKLVILSEIFKLPWLKEWSLVLMKFLLGCFNFPMMS